MAGAIPWIKGLEYITNFCAFFQFILEEAIQSGIMACYISMKQKKLILALKVLDELDNTTITTLEEFSYNWGDLAFWCKIPFQDFAKAARLATQIYRRML